MQPTCSAVYQSKPLTQARNHLSCKVGHWLRVAAAAASSDGIRFVKLVLVVQRVAKSGAWLDNIIPALACPGGKEPSV
jgi:hypothetical protein